MPTMSPMTPMRTAMASILLAMLLGGCDAGDPAPAADDAGAAASGTSAASTATNDDPDTGQAGTDDATLDGQFEIAGTTWGEAWTMLHFDDVALSMEHDTTIRVAGRGTPAVDRAADALTAINVETASPEGKRLLDACAGGCTLDAVIAEQAPGEWVVRTLRDARARPAPPSLDVGLDDPRRKPLLDALRPEIERDLGQPVQFVVDTLRERDGSAFVVARPRTRAGAPIDFLRTRHAERQREGLLDGDTVHALLQKQDGRWRVRAFVIGPTDVAWAGWAEEHAAPDALFPGLSD